MVPFADLLKSKSYVLDGQREDYYSGLPNLDRITEKSFAATKFCLDLLIFLKIRYYCIIGKTIKTCPFIIK